MNIFKKKLVVLIFILILFFTIYHKSYAAMGFGGKIISISICSNGLLIVVGPPVGGWFLLPPTAKIYSFFSIKQGSWLLGTYLPGGICSFGIVNIPVQGTIIMTGTSK